MYGREAFDEQNKNILILMKQERTLFEAADADWVIVILKIKLTLFTRQNLTLRLRKPRPPYFAGWLGALWYINFTNQQFATFSFLMGRFRTGRSKTTSFSIENDIDLAKTTSFSIENDIFGENDVVFDRKRHIWRKQRRFRSKTTLFWRKRHRFRSKTTLLKSNLWINFVP